MPGAPVPYTLLPLVGPMITRAPADARRARPVHVARPRPADGHRACIPALGWTIRSLPLVGPMITPAGECVHWAPIPLLPLVGPMITGPDACRDRHVRVAAPRRADDHAGIT